MSSALLYLAIVAVWGVVLVPMWLRRDGSRLLHRRAETDEQADVLTEPPVDDYAPFEKDIVPAGFVPEGFVPEGFVPVGKARRPARRGRVTRAAVIARRRRRTLGVALLVLASVVTV